MAILLLTTGAATGCKPPPLVSKLPRSPFQRFDELRGNAAPLEQQNAIGETEPALRERLSATRNAQGGGGGDNGGGGGY